jgi:hypothetical protein
MSRNAKEPLKKTVLEKDLGIHVDPKLQFSQHVEIQVAKANRILGLIRRTFTYLDSATLKLLFTSLVRPHLEYLVTVWNPIWKKDQILIEGVLRRATKLIPNMKDLPYEERLVKMKIPSMHYRRLRDDMIQTWKYVHNKYIVDYSPFVLDSESRVRGHSLKLKKPHAKKCVRSNFFTVRVIKNWNSLPESVISAEKINSFKNALDDHWKAKMYTTPYALEDYTQCRCSSCRI